MIARGINDSTQVVKPISKLLAVTTQNMETPQTKFMAVPMIIPRSNEYLRFNRKSDPRPIKYAIIGKDRMNPPVGPNNICHPPVKFANTGKPKAPNSMYINPAIAPRLAPNKIAASVMMNVCKVIGIPSGIGMESGAMTQISATVIPTTHSS